MKTLSRDKTGLLVIDVQEKLFQKVDRQFEVLHWMKTVIRGFQILGIPIVISEQYPKGLGPTVEGLKECLSNSETTFEKTSFSCMGDESIRKKILEMPIDQWVLVGIEAHVCVLQTAKDLINNHKDVIVLNNAITSRSIYDFSTAIAELRDMGVRITSTETVLFELLKDAKNPEFKAISELIK